MRLTEFWRRMTTHFGPVYVSSVAQDHVMAALGDRTIAQAIDAGVDPKVVWRIVCDSFDIPDALR